MQSRGKFFLTVIAIVLAAVSTPGNETFAADKDDARPWSGELPLRSSWLREHLPEGTLAYLRLPHPLGFLAAPKGNAMDGALRSTANVESLISIRSALVENVLEHIPGFEDAYLRNFADQLRSPIEVAVMLSPTPSAVISMNLDIDTNNGFAEMVGDVTIQGSTLSLLEPLDEDGFGQVLGLPVPASVYFDDSSGLTLLQAGPSVSADQFAVTVEAISAGSQHKMHAMERQVDTSGYGWFFWIDAESALPAAQMFMNEAQLAELTETGLDKVRAAAVGWGAANGKGRMGVVVDMARDGERQFLPYVSNDVSATTVGEPDALVMFSIPTAEEFSRMEAAYLEIASEESRTEWLDGKKEIEDSTGIRIEDVLNAIGPEIVGIFDEAGDYAAIRLRDATLFNQFVERVSAISGSKPVERRYKRRTFYQWALSTEISSVDETEADLESLGPLALILARPQDYVHWYQDGDFLYMASVPQPLIDRLDARPDTELDEWLSREQRLDVSSSFFAVTGSSDKLPRRVYHIYLELLQAMADISEAEFDIWSMPTASQVSLPDEGALGFSINLGDPYLSMEFMFENNPLESLFSGNMTSLAAVGILAAIAIPAYEDYTTRATVSQGLGASAYAKAAVAEHYAAEGSFPGPSAAAQISDQATLPEQVSRVTVVPGTGIIVVSYTEDALPAGGELYLVPTLGDNGMVTWDCSATIVQKHVPAACRGSTAPDLDLGGI